MPHRETVADRIKGLILAQPLRAPAKKFGFCLRLRLSNA
jgi:hypothetical protein